MRKVWLIMGLSAALFAGDIRVSITGVKQARGTVRVALYNRAKGFLHTRSAYKKVVLKARSRVAYRFRNVPRGVYAIAAFHDQNNNGVLDTSFLGIPKENFGTSNNVSARFGPPKYAKARFRHGNQTHINIRMR
jgi:uncharacterized protein (DUF2141 family)